MHLLSNNKSELINNNLNNSSFIHFNTSLKKMTAEDYNELAVFYKDKGLTKKVIYFYKKALKVRLLTLGRFHSKTISSVTKLAEVYLEANMIVESLNFYTKALELNQNIFGKQSLEVASIYSELASIHFLEAKLEEAFSLYRQSLKIREKKLGKNHPLTATSMYELGYFYAASDEYALALPLFEQSLETRIELYRLSHPKTAESYNSLAMCHYHLFNYNEAYFHLIEAIKIKKLIFPKNDNRILACEENLIEIRKSLPRKEKKYFFKNFFLSLFKSF